MAKKNVGLFWDLATSSLPAELEPKYFIEELVDLVSSLGPQFKLSVLRNFGGANVFSTKQRIALSSMGVEQIFVESNDILDIQCGVLMWLWDSARVSESRTNDSIVFVTSNPDNIPFIHELRSKSVHVIIVSAYSQSTQALCRSANVSVDISEIVQGAMHKVSVGASARSFLEEASQKDDRQYAYHERFQQQPIDMGGPPAGERASSLSHASLSHVSHRPHPRPEECWSDHSESRSVPVGLPGEYAKYDAGSYQAHHATPYSSQRYESHPHAGEPLGSQHSALYPHSNRSDTHSQVGSHYSASNVSVGHPREELYCQGPEELSLFTDLQNSFATRNVRLAVSSLRKTYTKQTRTFKIPVMLSELIPILFRDENGMVVYPSSGNGCVSAMLFLLSCIQWCFGVQRGEHVDSFKYKMNKNLAVWLLKILVNYVPATAPISPPVVDAVKQVVDHILDTIAELNFCMELLLTVKYPNIKEVLLQYVSAWQQSDNKTLSARAVEFALEHGFPRVSVAAPLAPDQRLSSMGFAPAVPHSSSFSDMKDLSSYSDPRSEGHGKAGFFGDFPPSYSVPERSIHDSEYTLGSHTTNTSTVLGGNRSQQHSSLSSERSINPQISDEACAKMTPDERLFLLVARSPQGLLGARIPSLYREAYGDRLRLQGRKLKDVLLLSDKVEMVGSDGPGDKLFRLVNHTEYQYLQNVADRIRGAAGGLEGAALPAERGHQQNSFSEYSGSMISATSGAQLLLGGSQSQMPPSHVYNPATYGAESLLSGADGALGTGSLETYRRSQGQPSPRPMGTIGQDYDASSMRRSGEHSLAGTSSKGSTDTARNFSSFYSLSKHSPSQPPKDSELDHLSEKFQGLGSTALGGVDAEGELLGEKLSYFPNNTSSSSLSYLP